MEVEFSLYEGFLIADYQEDNVKAYRSRELYAGNITSYETSSPANTKLVIDEVGDHGDFTEAEYNEVMRILGRDTASAQLAQEKKYQVSPDGVLLHDVLEAMENIAHAEGYGPLEGAATIDQIMHEQPMIAYKGYTRSHVEDVLKLALGAKFVHEV